jgi:PAS domain S-box-containing protein
MHKLLVRQIKKYLRDTSSTENIHNLFKVISDSYDHYEKDRKMLERSIELSSTEMIELNNKLRKETEESGKKIYEKLSASLHLLNNENESLANRSEQLTLEDIADLLKNEIIRRKQAENSLEESERKFRTLIENSSDVITLIDDKMKLIYASDSLKYVTGFEIAEIIGLESINFIHPDDRLAAKKCWNKLLADPDEIQRFTYRRIKKDGSYIWVESTLTNLLHDPAIKGVVINFRDITQRKQVERYLEESERKFRSLIENNADIITVVNEKLQIVFASESLYKVTGFSTDKVIGTLGLNLVHPDDLYEVKMSLSDLLKYPGCAKVMILRVLKEDGSYIWCEGTVTNMMHEPAVKGIVSNFRDISERITYEQELKNSNDELHKSNKELDKFVYSVSHDLRAPLSSVLGLVEYAETETYDENMLENLKLIKNSINKLDGFIQDILDYSRNSRVEISEELIDFKELLNDVTNNLKFMSIGKGNVEVKVNIEHNAQFYSDPHRLNIILNNLVSNAIRYHNPDIPDPHVEITIQCDTTQAEICVKDNGIGIDEKNQKKVFDMFYRVSKKSVGSGLGLYIVKETVEKLNGNIYLKSKKGAGSEFNILIPNTLR